MQLSRAQLSKCLMNAEMTVYRAKIPKVENAERYVAVQELIASTNA